MPIPKRMLVGPYPFTVHNDHARMSESKRNADTPHRVGESDPKLLTVDIDPSSAVDLQRETFCHELLHCLWFASGLDNVGKLTEEAVVSILSPILLDTLRRNPEVVAYLTEPSP